MEIFRSATMLHFLFLLGYLDAKFLEYDLK